MDASGGSVDDAVPGDPASVQVIRDSAAVISSVGEEMVDVLGWRPEELLGRPSTDFIHPEDHGSAIAAWFEMIDAPGEPRRWQGRYRTSTGGWRWIECENVSHLDDLDHPHVLTTMRPATVDQVGLAEELRARKELISRLSDAMPIGMFEIDGDRRITFANDRFHAILGHEAAATIAAEFSDVDGSDQQILVEAIDTVLDGHGVDDVELRFVRSVAQPDDEHVCVISLRPLTDATGAVTGAVGCLSDVTEQVHLRRQLELRASTDQLTSCLNRAAILNVLSASIADRRVGQLGLGVIFVDLCRFKEINDEFGHTVGDRVLEEAADRLRRAVRDGDHVGRFGGDEFLVVCPGVESERSALAIADRIRDYLTDELTLGVGPVELRASIGLTWSRPPMGADELVAQADQAMYRAKRSGSAAVGLFSGGGTRPRSPAEQGPSPRAVADRLTG